MDMDLFKGTARETCIDDLKEDEIVEILVRLPLDAIHRFKCVSKHWLAFISDPSFIRSYVRHRSDSPHYNEVIVWQTNFVELNFGHLPLNHTQGKLLLEDYLSFTFLPPENYHSFCVKRVSHGLFLCEAFRTYKPTAEHGEYYVCDPVTKQWLKIPPVNYRDPKWKRSNTGFMCYSLDSNHPHNIDFTILEVEGKNMEDDFFIAGVFTSKASCWTCHRVACPPDLNWGSNLDVVVYQGKFHWNVVKWIFAYDPINEPYKCNLIPTPKEAEEQSERSFYICFDDEPSQGRIRMVTSYPYEDVFNVYEITDYKKGEWCFKYRVNISDYLHHKVCLCSFVGRPTKGNIAWVKYLDCENNDYTNMLALLDMKSDSILSVVELPEFEPSFWISVYAMTPWPSIIPQLKINRSFEHGDWRIRRRRRIFDRFG